MNNRIEKLREEFLASKPHLDVERAHFYTQSYRANEDKPVVLKTALGLEKVLKEISIEIHPHELIVGDICKVPRSVNIFPEVCGGWLEQELESISSRDWDPLIVTEEDKRILKEDVFPYWRNRSVDERIFALLPQDTKELCYADPEVYPPAGTAILQNRNQTTSYVGNVSPNYKSVLNKGFKGIIKDVKKKINSLDFAKPNDIEKIQFLKAVLITTQASMDFAKRYSQKAKRMADRENDPDRKADL
jgi:formate C-acetyltransferase